MFCRKCGCELTDNAKFCAKCGESIAGDKILEKQEQKQLALLDDVVISKQTCSEDIFLFFQNLKHREVYLKIIKILEMIIVVMDTILTVLFIKEQFDLNERYRISIYILRYLVNFSSMIVIGGLIATIRLLFSVKKSDLKEHVNPKLYLLLRVINLVLCFVSFLTFINPSGLEIARWVTIIGLGKIIDMIFYFRFNIGCLIIISIIECIIQGKLSVGNKEV